MSFAVRRAHSMHCSLTAAALCSVRASPWWAYVRIEQNTFESGKMFSSRKLPLLKYKDDRMSSRIVRQQKQSR